MIEHGAQFNEEVGAMGLIAAIKCRNLNFIKFLLARGANPNAFGLYSQGTPLQIAMKKNDKEIIRILNAS